MIRNLKLSKYADLGGGLDTYHDLDEIPDNNFSQLDNWRTSGAHIVTRNGYSIVGSALSGGTGIKGLGWYKRKSTANDRVIAYNNAKLHHSDANVTTMYEITDTFTSDTFMQMKSYRDRLFMVSGGDDGIGMLVCSALAGAITVASTTIDLTPGTGTFFATSGVINIDGDEISYTGKSTDQLTGVTNISANHASGDLVWQFSKPTTGLTSGYYYKHIGFFAEKMFVAGASSAPSTLYYSMTATAANPNQIYDFSTAGSGSELVGKGGEITALQEAKDTLYIFKNDSVYYIESYEIITDAPFIRFFIKQLTDSGAVNNRCVTQVGNDVIYFTGKEIRRIGIESNYTGLRSTPISEVIVTSMNNLDPDQSNACAYYNYPYYKLFCKSQGETYNDVTFTYNVVTKQSFQGKVDLGTFQVETGKQMGIATQFKTMAFMGSQADGRIYKDEDSLSDNGGGITATAWTKEYSQGDPINSKVYHLVEVRGFINQITTLTIEVYVDGELTKSVTVDDSDIVVGASYTIGRNAIGRGTIGGVDDENRFEFYKRIQLYNVGRRISIRYIAESNGLYCEISQHNIGHKSISTDYMGSDHIT